MLPPEAFMHQDIKHCHKCALSLSRKHVIPGEGNLSAGHFLIAQAPGEMEDEMARMFVGPSGEVFWRLLLDAEADIQDVYMTNLLKCRLPRNRRPKQAEIQACSEYLLQELNEVKPGVVCPLGYYSTKFIFEYFKLGVFSKEEYPSLLGKAFVHSSFIAIPLSHPTSLIHHPKYYSIAKERYYRAFHLQQCKWFELCPIRRYTLMRKISFYFTDRFCLGDWTKCERYKLESAGIEHPDSLLPDGRIINL